MRTLRHGRTPRQARARDRVELILVSAASEFAERGFAQTTTNSIAKRAGVHVPSLYQYFTNKEALLAELWDRHVGFLVDMLKELLSDPNAAPIEDMTRQYVTTIIELHLAQPQLLAELYAQAPRLDGVRNIHEEVVAVLIPYLSHHRESLRPPDLTSGAFVLASAVEGVARQAAISPNSVASLVEETTALVTLYLGVT